MEAKDRIIVALNGNSKDSWEKNKLLMESLSPYVECFKVDLGLITAVGIPETVEFIHSLGRKVFIDGKFKDTSSTVITAVQAATKLGVEMFDVDCFGGSVMMRAAKEVSKQIIKEQNYNQVVGSDPSIIEEPLVFGVTLLTSLDYKDLVELGIFERLNNSIDSQGKIKTEKGEMERFVAYLACLAQECGLDGVVTSPQEIEAIRNYCQPELIIVTPGIRPLWAPVGNHKRTMTPEKAIKAGADYLVIGRPITQPPVEIGSPVEAVKRITEEVALALNKKE